MPPPLVRTPCMPSIHRHSSGQMQAEDGADDEDVAEALEAETMGEDEAASKELVFSA